MCCARIICQLDLNENVDEGRNALSGVVGERPPPKEDLLRNEIRSSQWCACMYMFADVGNIA